MMLRGSTLLVLPAVLSTVLACTAVSTNGAKPGGADGGPPDGGSSSGSTSGQLSCLDVLRCVGDCPTDATADACAQACVDRTAPSSQQVTQAFATCLTDEKCQDANCIKTRCGTELDACLADDASKQQGTPPSAPAPAPTANSIPADLVGIWSAGSTSYQFDADGSTTQVFSSQAGTTCTYGTGLTSSGVTTVVDGSTLVYHRSTGTIVSTSCGSSSSKPLAPADLTYRYALGTSDGAPVLTLSRVNDDGSVTDPLELHH
jgi:hypothetical protein